MSIEPINPHYNGLSPAQAERLAFFIEECGEAIQAACKVLRHGYESFDPTRTDAISNRQALAEEIGHVRAAMHLLHIANDIDASRERVATIIKVKRVRQWMHHQSEG